MMARWFLMMLGVMVSLSFAARYTRYNIVLSDSSVGYSQSQTVAQKLQTAPIAYYGSLIQRTYLQKDFYNAENAEFEQRYPRVYESFVGWANYKQKRQNNLLTQAPEQYQKMFEQRYALMNIKGFFLIHDEIRVEKIYDKATHTWVTPKPEDAKKELFSFAYVGPDISQDSSWIISQRMMVLLPNSEDQTVPVKRIFFMDGYSEECYSLMDTSILDKIHYVPHRLKYDVKPTAAMSAREKMQAFVESGDFASAGALAESADLSPRSKILMKILNKEYDFIVNEDSTGLYLDDYNGVVYTDRLDDALNDAAMHEYVSGRYCKSLQDNPDVDSALVCKAVKKVALREMPKPVVHWMGPIRFNAYADFGRPFLAGDFPDFDPVFYLGFGFNVYLGNWFGGLGLSIRSLDAKCDSCGTGDFGAHVEIGYLWLKKDYIESGVWSNFGFAAIEIPPQKGVEDPKYLHERYFRYGFGIYVEALFPKLIGRPVDSFFEQGIGNRFGVRLKLGAQNINISDIGQAKGLSPFVSLGITWHCMGVR